MTILAVLKTLVPPQDVLTRDDDIDYASHDQATNVAPSMPLAVVRVNTTEELINVTRCCLSHRVSLVVRGGGTGKSGGAVGNKHTVVIDTTRLNRILSIDDKNFIAEVEPGVILKDLQTAVIKKGLFYPPDPASAATCTLGGNVAENAAGPSTLKYGSTRDYLLGGQAIIGTGELIDFGKRCVKGVTGFDIAALLCGSEGTLAVFTKLILRLLPYPKSKALAMLFFDDDDLALMAVNVLLTSGHLPSTLEYVDHVSVLALKKIKALKATQVARALLIVECDASFSDGAIQEINDIASVLKPFGLKGVQIAATSAEREALWHTRSQLSYALTKWLGYKISEDIAVPLGHLKQLRDVVMSLSKPPHLQCALFGHAGDGNLHVQIMFDDEKFREQAQFIRHQILLAVLTLSGTLSAEHGIGLQKKSYLHFEQSPALIELQKRIKRAFDPQNLVNPGKIFDV